MEITFAKAVLCAFSRSNVKVIFSLWLAALKTSPALHEQRKNLERAKTGDLLRAKIQQRPDRQELERRHILEHEECHVDPSLAERQRMLKKARLADQLNSQISHRPGPLELIKKNILHTEEPIERIVKEGLVTFRATSEGLLNRPQQPNGYVTYEDDSQSSEGDLRSTPPRSVDVLETAASAAGISTIDGSPVTASVGTAGVTVALTIPTSGGPVVVTSASGGALFQAAAAAALAQQKQKQQLQAQNILQPTVVQVTTSGAVKTATPPLIISRSAGSGSSTTNAYVVPPPPPPPPPVPIKIEPIPTAIHIKSDTSNLFAELCQSVVGTPVNLLLHNQVNNNSNSSSSHSTSSISATLSPLPRYVEYAFNLSLTEVHDSLHCIHIRFGRCVINHIALRLGSFNYVAFMLCITWLAVVRSKCCLAKRCEIVQNTQIPARRMAIC